MKNDFPGLQRKKTGIVYGGNMPREFRQTEKHIREFGPAGARPHPVWQLNGNGSVGGQALTGIAALERLRRDPRLNGKIAVWPFETGFALPQSPVVLAEIYPSLVIPHPDEKVKDAGQVRALAEKLAGLEKKQTETLFATPPAYALDLRKTCAWPFCARRDGFWDPPAGGNDGAVYLVSTRECRDEIQLFTVIAEYFIHAPAE